MLVHFQFEPDGRITSPEAPPPESRKLVAARSHFRRTDPRGGKQLARLAALTTRTQLAAVLPQPPAEAAQVVVAASGSLSQSPQQRMADRGNRAEMRQTPGQQAQNEFDARNVAIADTIGTNNFYESRPWLGRFVGRRRPRRADDSALGR